MGKGKPFWATAAARIGPDPIPQLLLVWLLATLLLGVIGPIRVWAQPKLPTFESTPCPTEMPPHVVVDCGVLVVPQDYARPAAGVMRLAVAILRSPAQEPAPDPILYTEGGPGFSSLGSAWWLSRTGMLQTRDILILEQRGNHHAEPALDCPVSIWWEEEVGHTPCLDSLMARGIDPSHYGTAITVADMDALRRALGYESWNLYGSSYSTRLVQMALRDTPEGVRSAILQSVSPLDDTRYAHDPAHSARVLGVMWRDCAADPACATAYPELEERFYRLVARLNAAPVSFDFYLPPPVDADFSEEVDGNRLISWMVADAFYQPAYPPNKAAYLPLLIDLVDQDRTEFLYPWLKNEIQRLFGEYSGFSWGLYFLLNCREDAPGTTLESLREQAAVYADLDGYSRHLREYQICGAWGLPPAPPLATEPVSSTIPVLVMAGRYDPITPPEWSRSVADRLANSVYVEFSGFGHSIPAQDPCADGLKTTFLEDPRAQLNLDCQTRAPGPRFLLPEEVLPISGLSRSFDEVAVGSPGGDPLIEGLLVAAFGCFLAQIGFILLRIGRRWWPGGGPPTPRFPGESVARATAGLVALLNGGFLWLWAEFVIPSVSRSAPITLYLGIPTRMGPVLLLPMAAAVLTIPMVMFAVTAWTRRRWSLPERSLYSLVTVAAIVFAVLMDRWGFLDALLG